MDQEELACTGLGGGATSSLSCIDLLVSGDFIVTTTQGLQKNVKQKGLHTIFLRGFYLEFYRLTPNSFSVTFLTLGLRPSLFCCK